MTRQTQDFAFAGILALSAIALVACGRTPTGPTQARDVSQLPETATLEADQPTALARAATAAEPAPDVGDPLARREAELAQRERELHVQQEELRRERERLDAGRGGGPPASSDDEFSYDADQATSSAAANVATGSSIQKMPTLPIVVPPGTPLEVELAANVDPRIVRVGDRVEGRLKSDLLVGERRAAVAGAAVTGSVTELASGNDAVDDAPTFVVTFDSLQAANGATIPIVAKVRRQGEVKVRAGTVVTAPTETSFAIY